MKIVIKHPNIRGILCFFLILNLFFKIYISQYFTHFFRIKTKQMTAKNFFYCQAFLNISFGLGLLLTPQMLMDMYGAQKSDVSGIFDVIARSYGTLLTSLGITAYLMRDSKPSLARYYYLLGTALAGLLASLVHIKAIFQGVENSMSWLVVLSTFLIMVWSGLLVSRENKGNLA
jgi:hypothetical protein